MERRPDWKLIYSDPWVLMFARANSRAAHLDGVPIRGGLHHRPSPKVRAPEARSYDRRAPRGGSARIRRTNSRDGGRARVPSCDRAACGRRARANGILAAARGEVAEPGLRRTPGERVNSKGFRGFKSPPLRHAVPISTFSLPAITKKRAFAGQYWDLRAPEIAIESLAPVENCALFSVRKWLGALSICDWNTRSRPFTGQANLWRCVRHLSSDPCRTKNGLIAASRTGFSSGRERCV